MKKVILLSLVLALALIGCGDQTDKDVKTDENQVDKKIEIRWDMPTPFGDAVFHTVNINRFAEDVKTATNGAMTIRVHSGASLYKHPEIKRAVRSGQVPIGEILISLAGNENPLYQMDVLPL